MEINKKTIQSLSSLSDDELKKKITDAALSCGVSRDTADKYLTDIGAIRKKLTSLSDRQIQNLLSALGEENVRKIKNGWENGAK